MERTVDIALSLAEAHDPVLVRSAAAEAAGLSAERVQRSSVLKRSIDARSKRSLYRLRVLVSTEAENLGQIDHVVMDPEGRTIMNGNSTEPPALLDLRNLADGTYLLSWKTAMQQGSRTVVLSRSR
ncbi:MAG: hypothetical protein MUE88_05015 [Flavobacteriales bacterium]|jgi:hypothetical protein|nr:hypothetical protein [Flavobacteriales bacterium]